CRGCLRPHAGEALSTHRTVSPLASRQTSNGLHLRPARGGSTARTGGDLRKWMLAHLPAKCTHFADKNMLQHIDTGALSYRRNGYISMERLLTVRPRCSPCPSGIIVGVGFALRGPQAFRNISKVDANTRPGG